MLHKTYKALAKRQGLSWLLGPLLGVIAYCPLYLFMLAGSWLPHLLLLSLGCALLLLWKKRTFAGGWLLAWVLLASTALARPQPAPESSSAGYPTLKVAQLNVLKFNGKHHLVTQEVLSLQADVLAFQEVDKRWADRLVAALSADYPYYSLAPQDNCYGMALFSRQPLQGVQLRLWEGYPAISARIQKEGQDTLILSLHAASPMNPERFRARNRQLWAAAQLIRQEALPAVVIGDFNTVPWDPALRPLLLGAGMQDSRNSHYSATWPSPLGRLGIPIDYVLHSPHWQALSHQTFPIPGSDHKGLVATLGWKATPTGNKQIRLTSTP